MRLLLSLLAVCFAAPGCVDKGPDATHKEIDPAYIEKNLLTEEPAKIGNRIDADIGGKVIYLGNELATPQVNPGGKVRIVHYWKVVEPPGSQWRVFAHLVGDKANDWANIDYTDMRYGYPPKKWQAGDVIRDEQEFPLPDGWSSRTARIMVGLYPKGGHTASDRMAIKSGPVDKESRLTAATLKVDLSKRPASKKPSKQPYAIKRARGPITIDGRADEADWKSANQSPVFSAAEGGPALVGETRARLLWDDSNLYVFVSARDDDVASQYRNHDDSLWKEDVIELFIDADRNRRGYVELQVNPNNVHFDAYFPTTRAGKSEKEWNANMTSQVVVHGTANQRGDADTGWDLELAIPLAAVKGTATDMKVRLPPRQGDRWRLNVVHIDKSEKYAVGSWNQITMGDFHALGRMLQVQFADENGATRPARKPATTPGAPGTSAPGTAAPGTPAPGTPATQPPNMPKGHPTTLTPSGTGKTGSHGPANPANKAAQPKPKAPKAGKNPKAGAAPKSGKNPKASKQPAGARAPTRTSPGPGPGSKPAIQ